MLPSKCSKKKGKEMISVKPDLLGGTTERWDKASSFSNAESNGIKLTSHPLAVWRKPLSVVVFCVCNCTCAMSDILHLF